MHAIFEFFQDQTFQRIFVFVLLGLVALAFFREWFAPDLVAMFALGIVLAAGILSKDDFLSAFSNPAPVTIACMFMLSAGLERSGCIDIMGRAFRKVAGESELRVLVVLMVTGAVLSAFVNNTPVVVVFLPIVLRLAKTSDLKASRLLIPLSFACILGGTCTLTGTSTNLIIDGQAQIEKLAPFTMFELSKLGVIYAIVGFAYMLTFGRKLLPERESIATSIAEMHEREFLTQVIVQPGSPLIDKTLPETLLNEIKEARVIEVRRRGVPLNESLDSLAIEPRDRILISVHGEDFDDLKDTEGLRLTAYQNLKLDTLEKRPAVLMEGIIGPQSPLVGRTLKSLKFRQTFGVLILGVHRQDGKFRRNFDDVRLHPGDTLLIEGPPRAIERMQDQRDFVSLTTRKPKDIRPEKAWLAAGVVAGFVLLASLSSVPIVILAFLAAVAMLATRCLHPHEAYGAVQWNIIFLIVGMLGVGKALQVTEGDEFLASCVMFIFGSFHPVVILAAVYLLSSVLTELISNNAVAVLLTPIVVKIAASINFADAAGVDPRPFVVAIMFGCSASFATPIGYQTNTYVYGAGGYKFSDFPKVGIPLNLILWGVATALIPVFWPF